MNAGIETSIWLALKSRITSIPFSYAKAFPGQTFTPPSLSGKLLPFFRIGRVTATPIRQLVEAGKPHERTGSLIITLVHPLGQDISVYDQIGAQLAEHFHDGLQMRYGDVCVTVTSSPHVQEGYDDSGYWNVPVRVAWRCFA